MRYFLFALPVLAGIAVGFQAGVNGALGRKIGTIEASLVSFLIGTISLFILTIFFGKGNFFEFLSAPKWQWTGGILGAMYVFVAVFSVPRLGVAPTLAAVIGGQLLISIVIDHFGLMGVPKQTIQWNQIIAIAFMGLSLFFFYRK